MKSYIGLDIGGTKIYGGLITDRGDILRSHEGPSLLKHGNAAFLHNLVKFIQDLAGDTKFYGIGIGLAGHIDCARNRITSAGPNFPKNFGKIALAPALLKKFRVPVVLENDANVFGLGEAVFGQGKGHDRVVAVTLGTGIGGAIIQNKQLVHGKNNLAGEVGQMFTSDSRKTWEKLAAGRAFNIHGNLNKEADLLGAGLHNILNTLDPDIIVIGGGVAREPGLITKTRTAARQHLHYPALKKTPIVKSSLLRNAPILGAMLIAKAK
ncbi:ROK family protein [Patescibacteria group bacterium]